MGIVNKVRIRAGAALEFLRNYGQHLPLAVKAIFSTSCVVVKWRGTLKGGSDRVTILYGGRRWNDAYLKAQFFSECDVHDESRTNLFNFRTVFERRAPSSDVLIVDLGWPYNKRFNRDHDYLEMPDWMNAALQLKQEWSDVVSGFRHTARNNDLRLIRRNQYRVEVASDRSALESFYDDLYVPYASRKHGQAVVIAPRTHVIKRGIQGTLLSIYDGDKLVVAGVVFPDDGVLYFLWMGMPVEYADKPREGAISALYYFGIRYAHDNGYESVDFAGTRALLKDGDYRFKRKWGAFIDDTFSPSSILIRPQADNDNAVKFCTRFPVIARCKNGLEAVVLVREDSIDTEDLVKLSKQYACDGLLRTVVISINDQRILTPETETVGGHEFKTISCSAAEFPDLYANRMISND